MLLCSNYEESYAEDGKKRLASVKNYLIEASVVKRDMSERKLTPDTKTIVSKKVNGINNEVKNREITKQKLFN